MFVNLSILNAPLDNLDEYLGRLTFIPIIHLDIMDGKFVPEKSFGCEVAKKAYKAAPGSVMDVHLMVENPEDYFQDYKEAGADYITFQYEVGDIDKKIDMIHNMGLKAGLSIKPNTDVKVLDPYLDKIDQILIMSVEPGWGGQKFLPSAIDKVKYLKEYKVKNDKHFLIAIDGGINLETGMLIKDYCDLAIVGSAITKADNYVEAYYKHLQGLM